MVAIIYESTPFFAHPIYYDTIVAISFPSFCPTLGIV